MSSDFNKHYGVTQIRNSLSHFMVGKGFKIITSLSVLVLLARYMEETQYAVYISFQALSILIGVLSGFGFQAVLNRYLPELRANGNNLSMYRLMFAGISLRVLFLIGMMAVAIPFANTLSEWFNFQEWAWLLPWYLFASIVRLSALSLSQTMESLLWQKDAQYSLAIGSLIRLVLVLGFIGLSEINLVNLVIIEVITECLTMIIISYRCFRKWKTDQHRGEGNQGWLAENKNRVLKYGLLNYLVGQSTLLYGSAPNRMILAAYLPSANLAVYGFADGVANLTRRFMPTRLLLGFIRPIFMAHYSTKNNFNKLNRMSNFIFRVNVMILILPISILLVVGDLFFSWLTAGKYGESAYLLAGFLVLIIIEGLYALLELLVQAIEKNQIIIIGNIIKSLSLFSVIPLIQSFGVWSIILANIAGSLAACGIVVNYLLRNQYPLKMDFPLFFLNIIYGVISGVLGWLILAEFDSFIVAFIIIVGVYATLCIIKPPLYDDEKDKAIDLLLKSIRKRGNANT